MHPQVHTHPTLPGSSREFLSVGVGGEPLNRAKLRESRSNGFSAQPKAREHERSNRGRRQKSKEKVKIYEWEGKEERTEWP